MEKEKLDSEYVSDIQQTRLDDVPASVQAGS